MPERQDSEFRCGRTIVDVVLGTDQVEPSDVGVVARTAASAYAGLPGEHSERFSQV
jgi:hypothetical protein